MHTACFRRIRRCVRALPSFTCLALLFYYFSLTSAILSLIAILIHELGHVAVCRTVTHASPRFSFQSGGFCLTGTAMSEKNSFFFAAGGIAANGMSALLSPLVGLLFGRETALLFCSYSLLYAAFNLLPSPPLDGEKLLLLALTRFCGEARARRTVRMLSFVTAYILLLLSLFLSLGNGSCLYGVFLAMRLLYAIFCNS